PLHDALAALGAGIATSEGRGTLPVTVTGPLHAGGQVELPGDVSSQFLTALMLIAPLLDSGLRIRLTTPLVSVPYVNLTATVMAVFGIGSVEVGDDAVVVPPGRYRATSYEIEPDASSAGYPLAMAAVAGGRVTIRGLTLASAQGDVAVVELLHRMGCRIAAGDDVGIERDAGEPLLGIDVDMRGVSDLVPTIAAVATMASTPTAIRGVGFIRAKESDRLGDLAGELNRLGADVTATGDGLRIVPSSLHGGTVGTHHDHRLAMSFGVLGTAVTGVDVEDPGVVSKSWPDFWAAHAAIVGAR
ncbi:MAG: 3-phosphoshikimate 1-carboxyvinyltransferase, partial [Actinomycetota bacterium]|nr:3-phosphoshikimate 1-carboxyvinyltransferase [Actinomycetota bacterium]